MLTTLGATEEADQPTPRAEAPTLPEEKRAQLERMVSQRNQLDPERRFLVEEAARKYRIPLPPMHGFSDTPDPLKEKLTDAGRTLKVAALPMGLQAAGIIASNAISPGNVPLGIAAQSAGGLAGTYLNEKLGIAKPDELDYALSAGAPLGGYGVMKAGRRLIPGVGAAEQQIGAEALRDTPKLLEGSKQATDAAYDVARQQFGQTPLAVPSFQQTLKVLGDTEQTAQKYGIGSAPVRRSVEKSAAAVQASGGAIPLDEVNTILKRYREKAASAEGKGGEQYGAYKALRQALFKDMETASQGQSGPGAQAYRDAMAEAKKRIAKDEYTDVLAQHGVKYETVLGQTFETINPTGMLNKLKNLDFAASVGPKEWQKIESTLKELAKIPHPDASMKTGIGSTGRVVAMQGAGLVGATAGAAFGGAGGAAMGGAGSATAAAIAMKTYDAVSSMMMSDRGRKFLVKFFKMNQGRIGERTGEVLQFAASLMQEDQ